MPFTNTSSEEVNLPSTSSEERLTSISLMLSLCVHPRASRAALFWANCNLHLTTRLNSSPGATKLEPVQSALLILLLRRVALGQTSPHFSHCCINMFWPWQFTIQGYSKQFLVTSTCSISTLFITIFSWGLGFSEWFVPNTMILVFEIFRTNLFLATHSETNSSSLVSTAVISVAVIQLTCTDTLALLKDSGMLLVNIEKRKGPRHLPWGIPDSTWIILERLLLKNTLCVLLGR